MPEESSPTLKEIIERSPENKTCADCGMARPQWSSITYGIFLCLNCAGVHRSFGVKVSIVKSIGMDMWPPRDLKKMELGGNARFHAYLSKHNLSQLPKDKLYFESRVSEFAQALEKEVQALCPEQPRKPEPAPKASAQPPRRHSPSPPTVAVQGSRLSPSYATQTAPTLQANVSDMLGRAAGYLYTGASTLSGHFSEKILAPATVAIKEKSEQLADYLKGKEKTAPKTRKPSASKSSSKAPTSTSTKTSFDKWD
ncbi:ADP-ribosylation factor GTPase-activating protein 1 [Nematocida displodere]|uniref:ADP-ribosylation factor GTPase-activating protein 1 n=1 Tax=Nematocida displodere TaxID=1805483 RepID=A0A177EKX5_9MICR|nr:ADP-ribosylation factor GTPase-activating protein 1 [Nematocida displodere]